ncbi:MAG: MCE family protein, partial [Bacteroidales bacterium]|nr:MCE family protein [Bacteroidales bacterium]
MDSKRKKHIIFGVFAVVVLALSYWGFLYIKGADLFQKRSRFYVYYERVDGLGVASPVHVSGYKIGQVTQIDLLIEEGGILLVTFDIDSQF